MPRGIERDWKLFRDVYSGRIRKALKKFIKNGEFVTQKGKNGKVSIVVPRLDIPHIVHGESSEGIGRGPVKEGDVIDKEEKGKGKGNKAGQGESEGVTITLDLEEVLHFMQEDLCLPDLKTKNNQTFDEVKIKYNNISLIGPESLRHNKKTFIQAIKRQASMGTLDKVYDVPGHSVPIQIITPWKADKRYRQYNEIKIPSSSALVVYARDGSGSMDAQKCEIISDMAWWMDVWIKRFYERVETMYVWHDSTAIEVDEDKFYRYRGGGGTNCSSAFKYIDSQLENRFDPKKWNIYIFYFTDGDNWEDDNSVFIDTLKDKFGDQIVNLIGITQILPVGYNASLKSYVDDAVKDGILNGNIIRTTSIVGESKDIFSAAAMSEEKRNEQIMKAIKYLLSDKKTKSE